MRRPKEIEAASLALASKALLGVQPGIPDGLEDLPRKELIAFVRGVLRERNNTVKPAAAMPTKRGRQCGAGRPRAQAPRKIFLDLGANVGDTLWQFLKFYPGSVRFVRFVYDPGYVTANVGPVTLCDGPGVRCG